MKNKFGFNIIFAILAFPIAIALYKCFNFVTLKFEKPLLGFTYLFIFLALIYFMLKTQKPNN